MHSGHSSLHNTQCILNLLERDWLFNLTIYFTLFKNLFLPLYFVEEGLEVGVEISFVFNVVNVIDVKGEMVESVGGRTFESFFLVWKFV